MRHCLGWVLWSVQQWQNVYEESELFAVQMGMNQKSLYQVAVSALRSRSKLLISKKYGLIVKVVLHSEAGYLGDEESRNWFQAWWDHAMMVKEEGHLVIQESYSVKGLQEENYHSPLPKGNYVLTGIQRAHGTSARLLPSTKHFTRKRRRSTNTSLVLFRRHWWPGYINHWSRSMSRLCSGPGLKQRPRASEAWAIIRRGKNRNRVLRWDFGRHWDAVTLRRTLRTCTCEPSETGKILCRGRLGWWSWRYIIRVYVIVIADHWRNVGNGWDSR